MNIKIVLLFVVISIATGLTFGFAGGDGSASNPYQISTKADLEAVNDDLAGHYILVNDVNLVGEPYYSTAVIAPDTDHASYGFDGNAFTGSFNGNGFSIISLMIYDKGAGHHNLGLFGQIGDFENQKGEVKDLIIENCFIITGNKSRYIGGVCGDIYFGNVANCSVTGSIITGDYCSSIGGVCGHNNDGYVVKSEAAVSIAGGDNCGDLGGLCGTNSGDIMYCFAAGNVSGGLEADNLGGVCGGNERTLINCYATGNISGGDDSWSLGGLVGSAGEDIIVQNCYATGSVSGGDNCSELGGLCGDNMAGIIVNSYATGYISAGVDSEYVAGFCGYNDNGCFSNCFWDQQSSGMDIGVVEEDGILHDITGKTTIEMQASEPFVNAGWDFSGECSNGTNELWQIPETGGYPELAIFNNCSPVQLDGDGSLGNPYLIGTPEELGAVVHYEIDACYRLTSDIDLSGIQWSTVVIPYFDGSFDGNGFEITNLRIVGYTYLGLFGLVPPKGQIFDTAIKDCSINIICDGYCSSYKSGSLCVDNRGVLTDNSVSGHILANYSEAGGLCGSNYGDISRCYFKGSIAGYQSWGIGGLSAFNQGTLNECYVVGDVSGTHSWDIGGLCGYNYGDILSCYSAATVSGEGSDSVGGFCGGNHGRILNCFWDRQTSGRSLGIGGDYGDVSDVTGKTTTEMQTLATYIDAGWDFMTDWAICEDTNYPRLQKQIPAGDWVCPDGVGAEDLSVLSSSWLQTAPVQADINDDGIVDLSDWTFFADSWMEGI